MKMGALVTGFLAGLLGVSAQAAVVHNETVDGDLLNTLNTGLNNTLPATPNFGLLSSGVNSIRGSIDAGATNSTSDGTDEFDNFRFTTNSTWSFSPELVSGDLLVAFLYEDTGTAFNYLGARLLNNNDVFGSITNDAGSYAISITGSGNSGSASYDVAVNVSSVPVPAAAWLFGSALLGLSAFKRKAVAA